MKFFLCYFSAFRTVKNDPYLEVIADIDKAVFQSGRHEQHIARAKRPLIIATQEFASALHHNIDLVLIMGCCGSLPRGA